MWMIKYVQYLIITSIITLYLKVYAGVIKYLPEMINLKLNQSHVNWRLTVVQSERKTKITYHTFLNDKKRQSAWNVSNLLF